jgi:hypothetical protein
MPPTPTSRPPRTHVSVQVARGGGPGRAEPTGEAVSTRGRHRTPDAGRMPDPEVVGRVAPTRAAVVPTQPGAPSRHTAPAQRSATAERSATAQRTATAKRSAPAQRSAATVRGAGTPAAAPAASVTGRPALTRTTPSRPAGRSWTRAAGGHDDAVTDLVAGLTRRGDDGEPDAPATGPVPGLLGLALGVLALLGAVVAAAEPGIVVPVLGPLGTSPLALAVLLATALLATACAALGVGRHRSARAAAVTGVVVGLAAVAAAVLPLLAL